MRDYLYSEVDLNDDQPSDMRGFNPNVSHCIALIRPKEMESICICLYVHMFVPVQSAMTDNF